MWGQPAGIAAAAIAALAAGTAGGAIATWVIVSVLFWLLAIRIDAAQLCRWDAATTGALMVLASGVHFALRDGASAVDTVVWIVNAVLLAGGLALLISKSRVTVPT